MLTEEVVAAGQGGVDRAARQPRARGRVRAGPSIRVGSRPAASSPPSPAKNWLRKWTTIMRAPPSVPGPRSARTLPGNTTTGPARRPWRALRRSLPRATTDRPSSSVFPVLMIESASGTWSVRPPLDSEMIATLPIPSASQARTVSMVSVCELPAENVVQIDPVGADLAAERRCDQRRALLLERGVEVAEGEDDPDEAQRRAVLPHQRPDQRAVLVAGRHVADRRPVIGAVGQRPVEDLAVIEQGRHDGLYCTAIEKGVDQWPFRGHLEDDRHGWAARDPPPG